MIDTKRIRIATLTWAAVLGAVVLVAVILTFGWQVFLTMVATIGAAWRGE